MTAAPDMPGLDGPLAGAPITGTGIETGTTDAGSNSKYTWSSTSSAETNFDDYWHDSVCFFLRGWSQADMTSSLKGRLTSYVTY